MVEAENRDVTPADNPNDVRRHCEQENSGIRISIDKSEKRSDLFENV